MERRKAVIASTAVASAMVIGALGFAASSALGSAGSDNVGKLQPAAPTVTVIIDPATGAATATTAPAVTAPAERISTRARHDDEREEDGDD